MTSKKEISRKNIVVPAQGIELAYLWRDPTGDFIAEWVPVIAWKIELIEWDDQTSMEWATPITPENVNNENVDYVWRVAGTNGPICAPERGWFASISDFWKGKEKKLPPENECPNNSR